MGNMGQGQGQQPPLAKAGRALKALGVDQLDALFGHSAQRDTFHRIRAHIADLRRCETPLDFYNFQAALFQDAHRVDDRRAECTRIAKRLKAGKALPADAPTLPEAGDPNDPAVWEFEVFVHERLFRQFRSVGDGLAWRTYGYNRRAIVALSRNDSPGPLVKKAGSGDDPTTGLAHELGCVQEIWNERGRFALLHDLTNCLRIADVSEIDEDGKAWLHEVKANPDNKSRTQLTRMQQAIDSVMNDGPLPGDNPRAKLVSLTAPYRTNLRQLADLLELAHTNGTQGMKLTEGRAIVATSLIDLAARVGADKEEGLRLMQSERRRAIERAGIALVSHHLRGFSADQAARSALSVPWAIYPLRPDDCAALLCDLIVFETIISADHLAHFLREPGIRVEVVLPEDHEDLGERQNVFLILAGDRQLTVHADSLTPLLFELLEPTAWTEGLKELITSGDLVAHPVPVFDGDRATWEPTL